MERRRDYGVPDEIEFKTKPELLFEMVMNFKKRGLPFAWLGVDTLYGRDTVFLDDVDNEGIIYCADTPCDTRVWLEKPKTGVPSRKGKRGRKPVKEKLVEGEPKPIEVRNIIPSRWYRVFLRDTERKELWSQMAFLRVYPVRDELPGEEAWLIIRKDEGDTKIKYQLSNAPADTPKERLAEMSCSRYWIERMFQDANGAGGLSDYEVRGWRGWHHHMAMTMLVILFLLAMVIDMGAKAPMLTLQDVRYVLDAILPKKEVTKEVILESILDSHKARMSARRSHHKRDRVKPT